MTAAAAAVRAPRLMLIVEAADVAERRGVIAAALGAGVDAVQLRDRRASGGALVAAARDLRGLTYDHSAALLVNDRIDVALAVGADGVHLPAASFPIAVARRLLGPGAWIGRSTHSPSEAETTAADGADYVVLGPIFATPSKTAFGTPLGIAALGAAHPSCPLVAIGGITVADAPALRATGAHGVAVIRAILDADDPAAAARALRGL
jgi:thiamine-phosphate pyrophosphorylase